MASEKKPTKKSTSKPKAKPEPKKVTKPKLKHPLLPKMTEPKPTTNAVVTGGDELDRLANVPKPSGVIPIRKPVTPLPAPRLMAPQRQEDNSPHLIIEARAGTGKTTTLVCAIKVLMGQRPTVPVKNELGVVTGEREITPSPQQQAVWDAVALSRGKFRTVCFCAFNSSIAKELKQRVPAGCDAMTLHSLGFKAVIRRFGNVRVAADRVECIILDLLGIGQKPEEPPAGSDQALLDAYERELATWRKKRSEHNDIIYATDQLVDKCKMNMTATTSQEYNDKSADFIDNAVAGGASQEWSQGATEARGYWGNTLTELAEHYDIEIDGIESKVFELVPKVLAECMDVEKTNSIDFNDMIWIPVVLNLQVFKYDILFVDEAQDMNRCQHELIKRAGKRLILCGDPKQAIYGFAGADCKSMDRMADELGIEGGRGCTRLPLTVTRRCGKAIVKEANKIVPDFEAHESNGEGLVMNRSMEENPTLGALSDTYRKHAKPGDMILCRVNAPLVSECFRFIKAGRKANIQGRNIGSSLVSTVKKQKAMDVGDLIKRLGGWLASEMRKEEAKKFPSESKIIALRDRYDCIICFTEGLPAESKPEEVIRKIESVFTDDKFSRGIMLSSIHKAKGLEADTVFLLEPEGATCPHPMAKAPWQVEQEWNLRYVAITRAIKELVYVS